MLNKYKADRKKLAVCLISLVILTTLFVQSSVTLAGRAAAYTVIPQLYSARVLRDGTLWPFLDYTMYTRLHQVGDQISRYSVFGTLEDSTVVPILPQDLGVNKWHFKKHLQRALESKDEEKIKEWAEIYRDRHNSD